MPQILLVGEVVSAIEEIQGLGEGYLNATKGDKLEVLYVGQRGIEEEENWIYAKKGNEQGWFSVEKVQTRRHAGDVVVCGRSSEEGASFQYAPSDRLKVEHWGRPENKDEQNWIFAEKPGGDTGWIPLENIQTLERKASTKMGKDKEKRREWRQVLREYDLLPFPDFGEDGHGGYAGYEKTQVTVHPGLVVEVKETNANGTWTKVLLRQKVCGWLRTEYLGSEFLEEPPPPPQRASESTGRQERTSQAPPKPSRPAPRSKAVQEDAPPPPPPTTKVPPKLEGEGQPCPKDKEKEPAACAEPADKPDGDMRMRILVATFGLEALDGELADRCNELGGGAHAHIHEHEISDALTRQNFPSDVILDARMFPDPDAALLTRHSGRHHRIITRLCQHRNFPSWLNNAKRRFKEAFMSVGKRGSPSPQSLSVAVYCRRGKHRSVAAACILHHIFESEGFECPQIKHLSYAHWRNCCRLECWECQNPPDEIQVQLQNALKQWREL